MPIHEYECADCGATFEFLHRTLDKNKERPECPECGSGNNKKLFSSFSVGTLPSFGGGQTCCGADSPQSASCSGPGSCCSKH